MPESDGWEQSPWKDLRTCAEELARGVRGKALGEWTPDNLQAMIHELLVYQIELQMQNLELRQTQTALEASRERYFDLYESAPVGYVTLDGRGRVREANVRVGELLGFPARELVGRSLGRCVYPADEDLFHLHLRSLVQTGQRQGFELRMSSRIQGFVWVRMEQTAAVPESAGQPLFRATLCDITGLKAAEDEREHLRGQLAEARKMESLGLLARGMAHEVNGLLARIAALAAGHLQTARDRPELLRDLETVGHACAQGRALALGLVGFAKDDLAEALQVDLNALVRDEAALLERARGPGLAVDLQLEPDLRPVRGDAAALGCALMNLGANAVEAMPQGGRLTLRTANEPDGQVRLEVVDTGAGMPAEVLEKATEPFYTTKRAGANRRPGLGLALVYGAVRSHRGRLEILSAPGAGTTVRILLPAAPPEPEPEPDR